MKISVIVPKKVPTVNQTSLIPSTPLVFDERGMLVINDAMIATKAAILFFLVFI
ncbi:MAG: hypothetical protein R8G66_15165 [Cytophagales bacterium]|nr:hypothetical protein [Cytophagales bacterium]